MRKSTAVAFCAATAIVVTGVVGLGSKHVSSQRNGPTIGGQVIPTTLHCFEDELILPFYNGTPGKFVFQCAPIDDFKYVGN